MTRIDLDSCPPRRILIIKPSALGDVVHTLPVLSLLRRRWPQAHIAWLVGSAFAGLLRGHRQLDEILSFDRQRFGSGWRDISTAAELARFLRQLRDRRFDLVIDLQGLLRSGLLSALSGAAVRVGFSNARELSPLFYTHHVPIDSMEQHAIDRYLCITEALGCGRTPIEFDFSIGAAERAQVQTLLGDRGPFAVLLPGTNWPTKRWPADRFAELVGPLRRDLGLLSILAGGADAVPIAREICRLAPDGDCGPLDLTGRTSLRQLVALLERATLVIANDSGPMHIAAALARPLVTIFGPTNPIRTGPYRRPDSVVRVQIPCSPCYSRRCSHLSCMRLLETAMVLEQARRQIQELNDLTPP